MKVYKKIFKEAHDFLDDSLEGKEKLDTLIKSGFEALKRIQQHEKVFLNMPENKQKPFYEALQKLSATRHLAIMD